MSVAGKTVLITGGGNGVGAETARQLRARGANLVLTDVEMPEMDGFELTQRLRTDARLASTPIVAFTSTVNDIFKQRAMKVGMNGIILKTDREALLSEITSQLGGKKEAA